MMGRREMSCERFAIFLSPGAHLIGKYSNLPDLLTKNIGRSLLEIVVVFLCCCNFCDEGFTIPYITDTIPNSPAGHQLPSQAKKMC